MKTRDETTEKMERFKADLGVSPTLVSDGARESIRQDFRRVCWKLKKKTGNVGYLYPSRERKDRKGCVGNNGSNGSLHDF